MFLAQLPHPPRTRGRCCGCPESGVEPEAVVVAVIVRRRDEAHLLGIVFAPSDEELRVAPAGGSSIWYSVGTEPLCRNGAVAQTPSSGRGLYPAICCGRSSVPKPLETLLRRIASTPLSA